MTPDSWRRIKELFEAALDLEGPDRDAFIQKVRARDEAIGCELQRLVKEHEQAGDFLEQPLPFDLTGAESSRPESPLADTIPAPEFAKPLGRRIGPYQIVREIGHGGMGTVYLAERADGEFRKRVAVKLIRRGFSSEAIVRRFRNERQVLAALNHPNIARLIDGGVTEDSLPYLVMEYVEGVRIDAWCDGRKLRIRDRLRLFRKVCDAVQYAHDKQVIHRDLKPGNILVTADGTPELLDFGIGKVLNPELSAETLETTAGAGPMTPEYASPEQVRGERVGPASDVYALGMMLYRLLTGRHPYLVQGQDIGQVARIICEQEPVKPSGADLCVINEAVGQSPTGLRRLLAGDLDNIVLKALRKEPERRYQSVAEFSEDIGRFLQNLPVHARKDSLPYRGGKFLERHRTPTITAALTALLVLALMFGVDRLTRPPDKSNNRAVQSIAVLPLENLSGEKEQEYFADGMTDALIGDLSEIRSLRVISRESVMPYKGVHKPAALTARELKADALVEGTVQRSRDRVRIRVQLTAGTMDRVLWTQTYDRDLQDVLTLQSEAAKAIAREIQIQLTPQEQARLSPARAVNQQAYAAYLKGRYRLYEHTMEGFEKGIQHFNEALQIDPGYALAWAGLADGYYEISNKSLPPSEAMPKARAAALRALALDRTLAEAHATLATIQSQYDWDWVAAEKNYKQAIDLNPSSAQAHLYYGVFLAEVGRLEGAINEAAEANRLDPLPSYIANNLAWMHYLARHYDEAIARYQKILELDPNSDPTRFGLALAYKQKALLTESAANFQKFVPDPDDADWAVRSGHPERVRRLITRQWDRARGSRKRPYFDVGILYVTLREVDKAFECFDKALDERDEEILMLKVDPRLDSLRSDPRFAKLVRRIGLQP